MRTSIDLPDNLAARIKKRVTKQNTTFRNFTLQALEKALTPPPNKTFTLRDGSVGGQSTTPVSAEQINAAIDADRDLQGVK